ncbi:hypothetical protein K469DRAFT_702180 [Zopfia rhizophila CBS 207.26]|uniref:Uncharacterized protein n=1 Tax=Zopfia rhizophila CBS 207.26 TaxID=1314779 RepID=A0A6A6DBC6_9PEZI|nr:hypothetical protein K469DRAFT_702180 [Zopfia rhizophila CBS 207.26]
MWTEPPQTPPKTRSITAEEKKKDDLDVPVKELMPEHEDNCPWPKLTADFFNHLLLITPPNTVTPCTLNKNRTLTTPYTPKKPLPSRIPQLSLKLLQYDLAAVAVINSLLKFLLSTLPAHLPYWGGTEHRGTEMDSKRGHGPSNDTPIHLTYYTDLTH